MKTPPPHARTTTALHQDELDRMAEASDLEKCPECARKDVTIEELRRHNQDCRAECKQIRAEFEAFKEEVRSSVARIVAAGRA